jgi:hypothetical protein
VGFAAPHLPPEFSSRSTLPSGCSSSHSLERSTMYFHPSLLASAVLLSFSTTVGARVAVGRVDYVREYASEERNPESRGSLRSWSLRNVFRKRQDDLLCPPPEDDAMWNIVDNADEQDAQTVCNMVLQIPPTTTETEYTPTMYDKFSFTMSAV